LSKRHTAKEKGKTPKANSSGNGADWSRSKVSQYTTLLKNVATNVLNLVKKASRRSGSKKCYHGSKFHRKMVSKDFYPKISK